jgi:thiamine pyridinylase
MAARIKAEFESSHADIDLDLRVNQSDDFYDLASLRELLRGAPGREPYDVVETDGIFLGDLADSGWITPWHGLPPGAWHPAARTAAVLDSTVYGIPHWLCGHFLFTRDPVVAAARTVAMLTSALQRPHAGAALVGDFGGSWNLPALYIDAWADTHGPRDLDRALSDTLDPAVSSPFVALARTCAIGSDNPCTTTYHDPKNADSAAHVFGHHNATALVGYSERLHEVRKAAGKDQSIVVLSAPLGNGSSPVVYVDLLVRRSGCDSACARAAAAFAVYVNSPRTQEWVLLSDDAPSSGVPRYLLPANLDALTPRVLQDPWYRSLTDAVQVATPLPRHGWLPVHSSMKDQLKNQIAADASVHRSY